MLVSRRAWRLLWLAAGFVFVLAPFAAESWISHHSERWCFNNTAEVPECLAAIVLGTSSKMRDGRANVFFLGRINAAVDLLKAGRVQNLILSGDNGSADYDEPTAMKNALEARGIPSKRLVLDYAGFSTLDSVVRAREVFGQTRVVFVSQPFHNLRAVYIARAIGIEAYGYNAPHIGATASWKTWIREKFACIKALLDVHLLHTQPRFLGKPVQLP